MTAPVEPTTEPKPPADPPAGDPPEPVDDKPLGEGGEKALQAEREARKAAEKELAKFRKADEDRVLAGKSELEQAQARQAAAEEKAVAASNRAVKAEMKAAAGDWADPSDAPRYLDDLSKYVTADGDVDSEAIAKDLAEVLKNKPHLGKGATPRPGLKPDPSQGARGEPATGKPTSLGQALGEAVRQQIAAKR
ncbi:MAG: hypothetical protein JWO67_2570 [Streptosporangiaceae bacterium]|nr:hypothetical protein [Streptosporangiaceae bacterium]